MEPAVPNERIVSVGFLTAQDLEILGSGFDRHFPVDHDEIFADFIAQLDKIDASPMGEGVVMRIKAD